MDIVDGVLALGYDPLYVFFGAVVVDVALGVGNAVRNKTFDFNKFPSFLESQFGTRAVLPVAAAALAAYQTGGDVHNAALLVVVSGGSALTVSVAKDAFVKAKALVLSFKKPVAPVVK